METEGHVNPMRQVDRLIKESRRGPGRLVVFIPYDLYSALIAEIELRHKEDHVRLIVDKRCLNEGLENIIFRGAVVVCEPKHCHG